jgi:hypothetical protein
LVGFGAVVVGRALGADAAAVGLGLVAAGGEREDRSVGDREAALALAVTVLTP